MRETGNNNIAGKPKIFKTLSVFSFNQMKTKKNRTLPHPTLEPVVYRPGCSSWRISPLWSGFTTLRYKIPGAAGTDINILDNWPQNPTVLSGWKMWRFFWPCDCVFAE
jgi:hypothetical protein